MSVTPNYGFELLAPSQEQPEVPLNFDWNLLDTLLDELGGGKITVKEVGDSPAGDAFEITELHFAGATVEQLSNGVALVTVDSSGSGGGGGPVVIQLACSDLVTGLSTATSVAYCRAAEAFTLTGVRSSLLVDSSSGLVTVDIKKNGTTILSTQLSIDATELTSTTASTPAVISDDTIGDDDQITIDITDAGTGAKGLIVTLIGAA